MYTSARAKDLVTSMELSTNVAPTGIYNDSAIKDLAERTGHNIHPNFEKILESAKTFIFRAVAFCHK